jgi:hypothetical protein
VDQEFIDILARQREYDHKAALEERDARIKKLEERLKVAEDRNNPLNAKKYAAKVAAQLTEDEVRRMFGRHSNAAFAAAYYRKHGAEAYRAVHQRAWAMKVEGRPVLKTEEEKTA